MSKINIVRSIKTKNNLDIDVNINREMGWDNRFHLAKLQPYDSYRDAYFVNMKLLRDQFKEIEKNYQKTSKGNCFFIEKKNKNLTNIKNETMNSGLLNNTSNIPSLYGSYNNFNNKNNNLINNTNLNDNQMIDPEFTDILQLWDDLGVTDNYKLIFDNLSRDIDPLMRKDLFELELASLMKFSELLIKISKEIQNREEILFNIHRVNNTFLEINNKENILSDLILNMKNLRITSINIINYLLKIRELCSYNVLGGKFNLDNINKIFKFDKNYLIKMKFDMDFLCNSKLAAFFEFESTESDPFLIYFYFKNEDMERKYSMRLTDDIIRSVKQGQYLILQDLIYFNINSIYLKNLQKQERNLTKIKGIYGRDFSQPLKNKFKNSVPSKLYSPPKKNLEIRPLTTGFNQKYNFKKGNQNNINIQNLMDREKQFQSTSTNFYKSGQNNIQINLKEENFRRTGFPVQNIQNNYNPIINNSNNINLNEKNFNNIREEYNNPMMNQMNPYINNQIQSFHKSPNFKEDYNKIKPDVINFPIKNIHHNPNLADNYNYQSFVNNQISNLQGFYNANNPYQNYNINNFPMNLNSENNLINNNGNTNSNHGMSFRNDNVSQKNNFNRESLHISSPNNIDIFPLEQQRKIKSDRSSHENSRVIKVKSRDIVAIDKKETKQTKQNKNESSYSISIKTEENNNKSGNIKANESVYSSKKESSRLIKKIEEDLSIQDEIEFKKLEKKLSSGKFDNIKSEKIFQKRTESDIQEDCSYDAAEENKEKRKETKESEKNNYSKIAKNSRENTENLNYGKQITNKNRLETDDEKLDNDIESEVNIRTKKSQDLDKSEKYSIKTKTDKEKQKPQIKIELGDYENNKENSIDDIIDSKSLKDLEKEIHSDFTNDQPIIEGSKKQIETKESPKHKVTQQSRVTTENKLEIIDEESVDKSKSHIVNKNKNQIGKIEKSHSQIEDDYEKYNFSKNEEEIEKYDTQQKRVKEFKENDENDEYEEIFYKENSKISKESSLNNYPPRKTTKFESNKVLAHETFDSLKSLPGVKTVSHVRNEDSEMENKFIDHAKTEENYNFENDDNMQINEDLKVKEKHFIHNNIEEMEEEKNTHSEDNIKTQRTMKNDLEKEEKNETNPEKLEFIEHSRISGYSTNSKKLKAANKISVKLYEELREETIKFNYDDKYYENYQSNNDLYYMRREDNDNQNVIKTQKKEVDGFEKQNEFIEKNTQNNLENFNKMNEISVEKEIEDKEEKENEIIEEDQSMNSREINKEFQDEKHSENKIELQNQFNEIKMEKENDIQNDNSKIKDENEISYDKELKNDEKFNKSYKSDLNKKENIPQNDNDFDQYEDFQENKNEEIEEEIKIKSKENECKKILDKINKKDNYNENIYQRIKQELEIHLICENIIEFDKIYFQYKEKLDPALKTTFKPKASLQEYLTYFNPKLIKLINRESKELCGLCCVSYDSTCEEAVRLNINHISFLDFESFEYLAKLIMEYLREKFQVDEIIIELFYEYKDSNFIINTFIRDTLKNKLNFKWNKLENKNGERLQKLSLIIGNDGHNNELRKNLQRLINFPLEINFFNLLQLSEMIEKENQTDADSAQESIDDFSGLNYFSIISSICLISNKKNNVEAEILENYDKDKIKRLTRNFIVNYMQGEISGEINEKIKLSIPDKIFQKFSEERDKITNNLTIMKLQLKFSNFFTQKYNGYIYNKIHGSITTLINDELDHKFYILLTDCGNYTILLSEMKNGLKDYIESKKDENIYKLFDNLYTNLKNVDFNENAANGDDAKNIWIPSFSNKKDLDFNLKKQNIDNNTNQFIKDMKKVLIVNTNDGKRKNIEKVDQSFNLNLKYDEEFQSNAEIHPSESDIVIRESFLLSVINLDILADSQISTVFLNIIEKDQWN